MFPQSATSYARLLRNIVIGFRYGHRQPNQRIGQRRAWLRPAVSDSLAHDRHDAAVFERAARAERRQELARDNQPPVDVTGSLAERLRTTFTAEKDAEARARAGERTGAKPEKDAEKDAEARARAGERGGADGEKATPILAALARLRTKQSERARRGAAPRLRPVPPKVGKRPPGRGLVGGGRTQERRKPPAPKSTGRGGPAPRF